MTHNSTRNVNMSFSEEVKRRHGGETIMSCYQCGTCASSCPVAKLDSRFNPREIIKLSLLGEKEEIVSGELIWLCCSCFNCQERCPQNVEIADVFYALRNIALEAGHSPNIYSDFASGLTSEGRIVQISKFVEKKREEYGLPPIKPLDVDVVNKILSVTGFTEPKNTEEKQ
jgi:heterodisulfide reductase subunit C